MSSFYFILGLVCGLAIGLAYGLSQRRQKLLWRNQALNRPAADCSEVGPCSTCPGKRECGQTGCMRQAMSKGA